MANDRGRRDYYGDRDDFERRSRQQGGDYGRDWQQERGGSRQQHGERFSGDFRQSERHSGGGQAGGWQSDEDFAARQGGWGNEDRSDYGSSGAYQGSHEDRFGYRGRYYGGDSHRGDDLNRGSYPRQGGHGGWQDRNRWQDSGAWQSRGGYDERYGQGASGRGNYGGYGYGGERGYREGERGYRGGERDFWDKAGDEVSSWFGDEDAARRREMDQHRGRGPRNYARSDERIKEDVSDRLTDDGFLDATNIECSVENREVTLSGTVDSRQAKRRAEDLAESVSGVSHVQNNLRVRRDDDSSYASTTSGTTTTSTGSRSRKTSGI